MEPTIDAICRAMKNGDRAEAERILAGHTDHAVRCGTEDERNRIKTLVSKFRGTELPCDGPNHPHSALIMRQTSEFVVNAIIAQIDRPDTPSENPG